MTVKFSGSWRLCVSCVPTVCIQLKCMQGVFILYKTEWSTAQENVHIIIVFIVWQPELQYYNHCHCMLKRYHIFFCFEAQSLQTKLHTCFVLYVWGNLRIKSVRDWTNKCSAHRKPVAILTRVTWLHHPTSTWRTLNKQSARLGFFSASKSTQSSHVITNE